MRQYHDIIKEVLRRGEVQPEMRTGQFVLSIPSWRTSYDTSKGLPIVTTKNIPHRLPFEEIFWKLRGERTAKTLSDKKITIWNGNAFDLYVRNKGLDAQYPKNTPAWNAGFAEFNEKLRAGEVDGDLGPVYGYQWRHWKDSDGSEVDQVKDLFDSIKKNSGSRYHTLSAWNVGDLKKMAIGPCPFFHQFSVYGDNIDLVVNQRSCDVYLGIPFNDSQDTLLLHMVAREVGLNPRNLERLMGNTHIYLGVSPRADFWLDKDNVFEFRKKFVSINKREDYMGLRDWYLSRAGPESSGNEKKDHVPFTLEQLSKEPKDLPKLVLGDVPFFDAIHKLPKEVCSVVGYDPHIWDSWAVMAA
ncbi:MAG: thymidylate synthase [Nanoarchaeota archaeon]